MPMKFLKRPRNIVLLSIVLVLVVLISCFFWPKRIWTIAHINPKNVFCITVMQRGSKNPNYVTISDPSDIQHIVEQMNYLKFIPDHVNFGIVTYTDMSFRGKDMKQLLAGVGIVSGTEICTGFMYYRTTSGSLFDDPVFRKYVDPNGVYTTADTG